jgi:hypothetical protein
MSQKDGQHHHTGPEKGGQFLAAPRCCSCATGSASEIEREFSSNLPVDVRGKVPHPPWPCLLASQRGKYRRRTNRVLVDPSWSKRRLPADRSHILTAKGSGTRKSVSHSPLPHADTLYLTGAFASFGAACARIITPLCRERVQSFSRLLE